MFNRIAEARSILTHGLGENSAEHEKYMGEFRQMVAQFERLYPNWLRDRRPATTETSETKCDDKTPTPEVIS
jgi:hypothetical protein